MTLPRIDPTADGVQLTVKVVPGASRTRVAGVWGDALRVAVAAPPQGGKANDALCRFLADLLNVRRADVTIRSGETKPIKRIGVLAIDVRTAECLIGGAMRSE